MQNPERRLLLKRLGMGLGILLALLVLYLFATRGFLQVVLPQGTQSAVITITNPDDGSERQIEASGNQRTMLASGEYRVSVDGQEGGSIGTVEVGRFFRSTTFEADFQQQRAYDFVGNNPLACMDYQQILISHPCQGLIESVTAHEAANELYASINSTISQPAFGGFYVNDYLSINNKRYALLSAPTDDGVTVGLFPLSGSDPSNVFSAQSSYIINYDLGGSSYRAEEWGGGFLLVEEEGAEVLHFSSPNDNDPQQIEPPINNGGLQLYSIDSASGIAALTYTGSLDNELAGSSYYPAYYQNAESEGVEGEFDPTETVSEDGTTQVVMYDEDNLQISSITLEYKVSQTRVCGPSTLCVLRHTGDLEVYDFSSDEPALIDVQSGVLQLETVGDKIVLVSETGTYEYDFGSSYGNYHFTFGDYEFCGLKEVSSEQYLLCINNNDLGNRSENVLLMNTSEGSSKQTAENILQVARLNEVKTIAPYRNYVHISAEYGELEIDESTRLLRYNPGVVESVNNTIRAALDMTGLGSDNDFTVILPEG